MRRPMAFRELARTPPLRAGGTRSEGSGSGSGSGNASLELLQVLPSPRAVDVYGCVSVDNVLRIRLRLNKEFAYLQGKVNQNQIKVKLAPQAQRVNRVVVEQVKCYEVPEYLTERAANENIDVELDVKRKIELEWSSSKYDGGTRCVFLVGMNGLPCDVVVDLDIHTRIAINSS